jgi:plastocyanin
MFGTPVRPFLVPLIALALAGAGCGSDSPTEAGNGPVPTNQVSVEDFRFTPGQISVPQGSTVTWTWAGQEPHDVVWASGGLPDSQLQTTGTHQVTMSASGEFVYYCSLHGTPTSGMRGSVRVD